MSHGGAVSLDRDFSRIGCTHGHTSSFPPADVILDPPRIVTPTRESGFFSLISRTAPISTSVENL